jgi:polyhydroxyalkanoate synthase
VLPDPREYSKAFAEVAERSQLIVNEWLGRSGLDRPPPATANPFDFASLFVELTGKMMTLPASVVSAHMSLWQDYFALWQNTTNRMPGRAGLDLSLASSGGTAETDWRDVDVFSYVKQSYLLAARWTQETMAAGPSTESLRDTMDFCARQLAGSLTPLGFAMTNPEVIRAACETHGENLINGLRNVLNALEPACLGTAAHAAAGDGFVVGKTVATTPGKVIFRNPLIELIQYSAATERVWKPPLLLIPPWTNRYYLFDLRQRNSFVRFAVAQGHTVFALSWADPDPGQMRPTFEDYVVGGPIAALDAIRRATGEAKVNGVGFGLGGTVMGAAMAYLAAAGEELIGSATFLASLLDFSEPGELGSLIEEETLCHLEEMLEHGRIDGRALAQTSTLQRETDLLWSFVVNNYLLGKDPFPADLLRWNRDTLRLPYAAHAFYLRQLYQENRLAAPGGVSIGGQPLDLGRVNVPSYILAAREDHIVPWRSAFKSSTLLRGDNRFTLAASGHLAGVLNPPEDHRYCYWTNSKPTQDADEWRAGARPNEGSWWRDWDGWLRRQCGKETVAARRPGACGMAPICDAPGNYVCAAA